MNKKKLLTFGILGLFAIALVTAGLLTYYGQIQQTFDVDQAVTISGGDCSGNDCTETFTDVYSPDTRVSEVYTLTNNDPLQNRDVNLVTSYNPTIVSGEIVTTNVEYFDDAGADFSDYATNGGLTCGFTIEASTLGSITDTGIVCVNAGIYTGNVNVPVSVTLVAVNAPDSTTPTIIDGEVTLNTGATLKGFRIDGLSVTGAKSAIHVSASDVTVDSNIVYNMDGDGTGTIKGIHVYSTTLISNIVLTNNLIEKIYDTGKGSVGIMVQGNLNGVTVTYNTLKDITSDSTGTATWDYSTGIEVTPTSGYVGSPLGIIVNDNHVEDIVSVTEIGRGFSVDMASDTNYAYSTEVTLKRNNFVDVLNDITSKDQDSNHILDATDNWFGLDGINVNVNGVAKKEIGIINADWMTKIDFKLIPNETDGFGIVNDFVTTDYTGTITTTVLPA